MSNVSRLVSFSKPFLASMERRVGAFVIDAVVLFLAGAVLFAIVQSAGINDLLVAFVVPVFFTAYHAISIAHPGVGLGRTVAAISVVSIRRSGELSQSQAVTRAVTRTLWLVLGFLVAQSLYQPWVIVLPLLIDLALVTLTPWRQSIVDLIAGTVVVNTPPLQPHRAPAGPMFSKNDAEFGHPPREGG